MTTFDIVTISLSGGALAVSAAAAWFARTQLEAARAANALTVVVDVFNEFRGKELAKARVFVWRKLEEEDPSRGFEGISDQAGRDGTAALANYLDHLGLLVHARLVDENFVVGYMGGAIVPLWDKMRPFVLAERKRREMPYMLYFEGLVATIRRRGLEQPLADIPRLPPE